MSAFKLGATYKLSEFIATMMVAGIGAKFSGELGVFTVAKICGKADAAPTGAVYTDDITSTSISSRCLIPAAIVDECELLSEAADDGN